MPLPNERIFVGLDVPTAKQASILISQLAKTGCGFKIGPHFIYDPEYSHLVDRLCSIPNSRFGDLKHLDIPETVRSAVTSAAERRFNYVTIHAHTRHRLMMQTAVHAAKDSIVNVLAVPLLTSETEFFDSPQIRNRVDIAIETGCHGIICAPSDVAFARTILPDHFIIGTPGIVMDGNARDHARTGTPEQAIGDGANFIVVARYVINTDDPLGALQRIVDRIA